LGSAVASTRAFCVVNADQRDADIAQTHPMSCEVCCDQLRPAADQLRDRCVKTMKVDHCEYRPSLWRDFEPIADVTCGHAGRVALAL